MALKATEKIWHNGSWINWDDAKIHVLSHVVGYGSAVFEGIRCYDTRQGPAIFRLGPHMHRLLNSAKIYRMDPPFTVEDLSNAAVELVRINKLPACYVKPIVLRGYGDVSVNPLPNPIEVYMACWPWGAYLGPEAQAKGVDVCVSTWARIAPNTLPAMSKAAANYMNSQLIRMEAGANGYAEGIALDSSGYVSEGSGMNVFVVQDGTILTPPLSASILPGITRNSIVQICADLKIPVRETVLPREMLYIADEIFFVGTAVEVTPVRSVDKIVIGKGVRGEITRQLQDEFFALTSGTKPDRHNWLTPVGVPVSAMAR
ncbi:MAG TPA: branched-chain amino acid transaminase [Candidatus Dormibacteraeota bacterium]|nr:branched-chain amino acid transaminase [Candidatus Dormibacteraeota bacterium]